jgi:rubrerythrin
MEEMNYYWDQEEYWRNSLKLPSINEIHNVFPEMKSSVNKIIKEVRDILNKIELQEKEMKSNLVSKIKDYRKLELTWIFVQAFTTLKRKQYFENRLQELEKIQKNYKMSKKSYDKISVEDVKQIPISDFIEFRNNKHKCLWHDEKTPSMHYNRSKNTVKCFGCGKFADVIDVVQELYKVDFVDALKILKNKI